MSPLFLIFFIVTAERPPALHHFTSEDEDNNGILTTTQFIEGLISAFTSSVSLIQNFEKDKQNINDFGREFAGRKETKGFVKISDIKQWLETEEIYEAYVDWRYIIEEGENHLSKDHIHKRPQKSSN